MQQDITHLLHAHTKGNRQALDELLPLVYDELRRIAQGRLRNERADHTLNTTALVHEAYLKLVDLNRMNWQGKAHFFAVASRVMHNVLIDYAEKRNAQKRDGGQRLSLNDVQIGTDSRIEDLLALNDALSSWRRWIRSRPGWWSAASSEG